MQELFTTNFIDVLKTKYAEFSGREKRRPYWMFVLCIFLINAAVGILASIFANNFLGNIFTFLASIFSLAVLVPSLGMAVRRLHDIGKDWPWIFIVFIPFIGWIWMIVLLATDSQPADNQFGPYEA